ncbi:MAG: hypothetical protein RJQ09_10865 [Cyclobacteriaceae bacterium]
MIRLLTILTLLTYGCGQSGSGGSGLQEAYNVYFQMDHEKAYELFEAVWNDSLASGSNKAEAGRNLAKMDWMLYSDFDGAYSRFDDLIKLGEDIADSYLGLSRAKLNQEKYDDAVKAAKSALENSPSDTDRYSSEVAICTAILEKYLNEVLDNSFRESQSPDFIEGIELSKILAKKYPGDTDVGKLQLGYNLIAKNGADAFKGWMSYYRLIDPDQIEETLVSDKDKFLKSMLNYKSDTITTNESIETIVRGLAESGFYEYAAILKKLHFGDEPHKNAEVNDIVNYQSFLAKISDITLDFYHQTVAGSESRSDYEDALLQQAGQLWQQLSWPGEVPEVSREAFVDEMKKRFKVVAKLMDANGSFGLHWGHAVINKKKVIEQYGESAEFVFVAIDHMVSNGYSSWFWDGAQVGGWADDGASFLQVRSAYTSGPVRSWNRVSDPEEVKSTLEDIEKFTPEDDSIATKDPYAFLPALSKKLSYYEEKEIYDSLINAGYEGSELRLAFINTIENLTQESSIFAHEGRHAIDKKIGYSRDSEELEYTAKLSEIYFTRKPFLGFDAIMSRNIGDDTSHGQANLRVIKGVVNWMEDHQSEIVGFDTTRPTLPQLLKLTEDQLRAAVKSLDPLAKS